MTYFEIKTSKDLELYQDYKRHINRHKSGNTRAMYFREDHDLFRWEHDLRDIENEWRRQFNTTRAETTRAEQALAEQGQAERPLPTPPQTPPPRRPSPSPSPSPHRRLRRSSRIAEKKEIIDAANAMMSLRIG